MNRTSPIEHMLFEFKTPEEVGKWRKYCDSDLGGFSSCRFLFHPDGRGIFEGHLNLDLPRNSRLVRTGYAAIMSPVRFRLLLCLVRNERRPTLIARSMIR